VCEKPIKRLEVHVETFNEMALFVMKELGITRDEFMELGLNDYNFRETFLDIVETITKLKLKNQYIEVKQ